MDSYLKLMASMVMVEKHRNGEAKNDSADLEDEDGDCEDNGDVNDDPADCDDDELDS